LAIFSWFSSTGLTRASEVIRGAHIRFSEPDLVSDKFSLRIATSFDFHNQASQDVSDRILLATAQKSTLALDARVVRQSHLIIRARPVANGERVSSAINYNPLEFHFGAARDWPESWGCTRSGLSPGNLGCG
jgi:hypothetical protein